MNIKKIIFYFLGFLILALLYYVFSQKEDRPVSLLDQTQSQENSILLTADSIPTSEQANLGRTSKILYIDQTRILFMLEDTLMSYSFETGDLLEIAENVSIAISPNLENIFLRSHSSSPDIYSYSINKLSDLQQNLLFTQIDLNGREFPLVNPSWLNNETIVMYNIQRDAQEYAWNFRYDIFAIKNGMIDAEDLASSVFVSSHSNPEPTLSPSGKKIVYITDCEQWGCLLSVKTVQGFPSGGTIAEVDGCSQKLWSPDERFFVYDDGYDGPKETSWIFDFQKDSYTSRNYNFLSDFGTYDIQTDSTSLTHLLGLNISKLITWLDNQTLLLETTNKNNKTFWLYDARLGKFLQISAEITVSEGQAIEDALISKDLKKIAFIKNYNYKRLESLPLVEQEVLAQELWVANADGSDPQLIYKNYP